MPYEYREMTPEERASAVLDRRQRGYPLHSPPHPYREAGWYCISSATFEHALILLPPLRCTRFEEQLLKELKAVEASVAGWAILPNHYHFLAEVQSLDRIGHALKHLHGTTSRAWNLEDGQTGKRIVWYRFIDRCIRDEHHYYHALNYIHFNAVRHGYVDSPYDWPWCSVHEYFDTLGRDWLREQWVRHPVGDAPDYGD